MNFYSFYTALCINAGKSPSAVALENGLSKTAVSGWKTGRCNPTSTTKHKLAVYFDLPYSLFDKEEFTDEDIEVAKKDKKISTPETNSDVLEMAELITMFSALSPDEQKQTLDYMRFRISQRKQ